MKKYLLLILLIACIPDMYAQKKVVKVEAEPTSEAPAGKTIKRKVAVGRFSNETQYSKGLFYDKENDPMGKQALDILSAKLAASEKFILLERGDLASVLEEMQRGDSVTQSIGADYLIIGSVTEFGRKNIGEQGIMSTKKTQIVEAAVSIRLVDVSSGLIIYSDEAKGSSELSTKTTMGLGGNAGYDASLSDKAISAAISQLVENIINKCTDKPWRSYFLSCDDDAIIVGGGASQGIVEGDTFAVYSKGKKVKNPQSGLMVELPGKKVGMVKVLMTGGDTPESEYSFVEFTEGEIPFDKADNYYIEEIKQ